jgi:hypothetical protein
MDTAVCLILATTSVPVRLGLAASMSAAVAVTWGTAIDVPDSRATPLPGTVDQIRSPGAATEIHVPKSEKVARTSARVVAATLKTPGYSAG